MRSRMLFGLVTVFAFGFLFAAPVLAEGLTLGGTLTAGGEFLLDGGAVEEAGATLTLKLKGSLASSGAFESRLKIDGTGAITLREAFLDLYLKNTDLRLGRQRIAWGTADGINPTDNLNPVDYTRPFAEDNRLEVTALRARHYLGDWTAEFVWLPVFVPAAQPEPGSRWAVPVSLPALPPGLTLHEITVMPTEMPEETLENSEFAVKLGRTGGKVDFSVSYFSGWDDLPSVHAAFVAHEGDPTTIDLILTPIHHRLRVLGADFATTSGKWGFRGEAAYFMTEDDERMDPSIKNPYLQAVLGADWTPNDRYYFNGQVVAEYVSDSTGTPEGDEGTAWGLMLAAEYKPRPELTLGLDAAYNVTDGDYFLRPRVSYSPADGVTVSAGCYLFEGSAGTMFGNYAARDYFYAEVEMAF
ncbi:MAG: hypothetical protein GX493_12925 [Firmicutes bacterium]|nr:hypothetical protein [Bacillota bacterium]